MASEVDSKLEELAALGLACRGHKAQVAARDALIRELWASGDIPRADLAALAQVTPGRVSQITEGENERGVG